MRCCRRCPQLPSLRRLWSAAAMRSLSAREERHCSPSFHPIPRACYRRVRDHDTIVVPHGRRKSLPPRQPCSCCERFARKRQRMKKAPFSGSFLRAVAENVWRGQAHIVRREGWGKCRAEKREALFVCTVALPVSWDVPCLAPDASPPGSAFFPRTAAAGTVQRDRKKHFRGKEGRGRKTPLFQKGLLPLPP